MIEYKHRPNRFWSLLGWERFDAEVQKTGLVHTLWLKGIGLTDANTLYRDSMLEVTTPMTLILNIHE